MMRVDLAPIWSWRPGEYGVPFNAEDDLMFNCPTLIFSAEMLDYARRGQVRNATFDGTYVRVVGLDNKPHAGETRVWKMTGVKDLEHNGFEGKWPD
jgi:hypothetical protein